LAENLAEVRARIDRAAAAAGRDPAAIRLLTVTKTFPVSDVALLVDLGLADFAENRDAEAAGENEERHAADPHCLGLLDLLTHHFAVRAFREQSFDQVGVEPAFRGDFGQHDAVADVASLDEIGLKQSIDHSRLDAGRREVTVDEVPVELSRKEFDLLALLMSHSGQVVTRDWCIDRLWWDQELTDTRTLDTHIKRLRRKVEPDPANPRHLVTVRGVGFRFEG